MTIQLRESYDTGNVVNEEPLVAVFEDFVQPREIDALLRIARPQLQRALVSDASSGVQSAGRSGSNCWIAHDHDEIVAALCQRLAQLVGLSLDRAESLQVVYYAAGEEYAPHYDAWDATTERGQRCLSRGGQRLVTCLLYLNEPPAGGGTSFPKLDMEVRARRGRMVLFHNCHPGGNLRHPDSLHGGLPVLEGEKWACNLWFRERQYQKSTNGTAGKAPPSQKFSRVI